MNPSIYIRFLIDPAEIQPPKDWNKFEMLVLHHRYFYTLEEIFRICQDQIPFDVKSRLKEEFRKQLQNQLRIASELQEIITAFNKENIGYIHLKGTTLALQLYGKIGGRFTRDIDFLVPEDQVDRSLDIFHSAGYRIIQKENEKFTSHFRRIKKNQTLFHPGKRTMVELHWDLFSNRLYYPFTQKFLEGTDTIDLNQSPVRIMNRENIFVYLCLHGAYHEYFRLFWLRDIGTMLKKWELDWENIIIEAENDGIIRILASSALLAGRVFKLPTPFDKYSKDPKIQWLVNNNMSVINRSSMPGMRDRAKRIIYFMKLKENWMYKAECAIGIGKRYIVR